MSLACTECDVFPSVVEVRYNSGESFAVTLEVQYKKLV